MLGWIRMMPRGGRGVQREDEKEGFKFNCRQKLRTCAIKKKKKTEVEVS